MKAILMDAVIPSAAALQAKRGIWRGSPAFLDGTPEHRA